MTNAAHKIEIEWQAASAPGANDGVLTLWLDGSQVGTVTTLDNDTRRVNAGQMGPVAGIDTGTRGTEYFDAFVSRRSSYIGLVAPSGVKVVKNDLPEPTRESDILPVVYRPSWLLKPLDVSQMTGLADAPRTITYAYDPLGRLISANYGDGNYFVYTYDAVGNRLSETTQFGTTTYTYDAANRLATVNAVSYTWDDNGNLLSDGVSTYTYTNNKLSSITSGTQYITFQYNGLGDRVSQTVNGLTTHYTLDLNAGLTQVLADGTNTYLYGYERIAQFSTSEVGYFLGDALGSVRQITDEDGVVTLTKQYEPYGDVLSTTGSGESMYGFDGEQTDASGLQYLRARYYATGLGRFISHDSWGGDSKIPMSYNAWLYGYANPVNFMDPSGNMVTPWGIDNNEYVYSCKAGFIDFGHAGSINAFNVFNLLEKGDKQFPNSNQGYRQDVYAISPQTTVSGIADPNIIAVVKVGATKNKLNQIALGIYRAWMEKIENAQWWTFVSDYSYEDLPSDEIGFYLYLHFKRC